MTLEIQDKGKYYMYKNVIHMTLHNGEIIYRYTDNDGEVHEEFGPIPEYFRVMDCE